MATQKWQVIPQTVAELDQQVKDGASGDLVSVMARVHPDYLSSGEKELAKEWWRQSGNSGWLLVESGSVSWIDDEGVLEELLLPYFAEDRNKTKQYILSAKPRDWIIEAESLVV